MMDTLVSVQCDIGISEKRGKLGYICSYKQGARKPVKIIRLTRHSSHLVARIEYPLINLLRTNRGYKFYRQHLRALLPCGLKQSRQTLA